MSDNANLKTSLKKLQSIMDWFEEQEDIDVEEGLKKVKEGAELIKKSRKRLQEVENEFEEVKKSLEE